MFGTRNSARRSTGIQNWGHSDMGRNRAVKTNRLVFLSPRAGPARATRCTDQGEIWNGSSFSPNFTFTNAGWGTNSRNIVALWGRIPCAIRKKFSFKFDEIFRVAFIFLIWSVSLNRCRSYRGFTSVGAFPRKFHGSYSRCKAVDRIQKSQEDSKWYRLRYHIVASMVVIGLRKPPEGV